MAAAEHRQGVDPVLMMMMMKMMIMFLLDEMTTTGSEGRDDVQRRQFKQGEGDILYKTNRANNLTMESGKTRTSTTPTR